MKIVVRIVLGLLALIVLAVGVLFVLSRREGANVQTASIEIGRPPAEVFPWLTEPEKVKQWVSWLAAVEGDKPAPGAHLTWVMDDPNMKQQMRLQVEVLELQAPRLYRSRVGTPGMFTGDVTYAFEDKGGRTLVTETARWEFGAAFARLMAPLVMSQASKKLHMDFERLKSKVEAQPQQPAASASR
jgi:uncharacterized protein YndB with AHSA1/START domain